MDDSPVSTPPQKLPRDHAAVVSWHQEKLDRQLKLVRQLGQRWSRVAFLRGSLFLAALVPLLLGLNAVAGLTTPWYILAGLLFAGFLLVAFLHEGMQRGLAVARLRSEMHRESLARLKRDWKSIPDRPVELPASVVPISVDLDLFGPSSLHKLLGTCRTPVGMDRLRDWIITGALPDEVASRQEAVRELAEEPDWIEQFRLKCEQLAMSKSGPARFVDWCESPDWFNGRRWILWVARTTAAVSAISFLGLVTGWIPLAICLLALAASFIVNFFMAVIFSGGIHDVFNMISARASDIQNYVDLFQMVADYQPQAEKLKSLQRRMLDPRHDVRRNVGQLSLLVWMANLRRHGILFLAYLFFEFFFFWDPHVLSRLEAWKRRHGTLARDWFDDLGTWESLVALAVFAADHPEWCYPNVHAAKQADERVIRAEGLAHPMLGEQRVANDVMVGPPGTVLLVTGSNMSGKSTLLRSIGINSVLAQMGTVVAARQMSLPPLHLETSMKIADSLADGVSFFMAELKRLKQIVDQAGIYQRDPDRTMLFLLDEILQGTNSRERQIAVSRVVRKLVDEEAIGAISTHDLDLATTPELEEACRSVHFSEHFVEENGRQKMTFDYRMRQGVAETTNALKLLEMVGLGDSP